MREGTGLYSAFRASVSLAWCCSWHGVALGIRRWRSVSDSTILIGSRGEEEPVNQLAGTVPYCTVLYCRVLVHVLGFGVPIRDCHWLGMTREWRGGVSYEYEYESRHSRHWLKLRSPSVFRQHGSRGHRVECQTELRLLSLD